MAIIISLVIAYLLGSINNAILICFCLKLGDPRKTGSGNPGATNVLRMGHSRAAAIILLSDLLKGLIAVIIGRLFHLHGFDLGLVAFASFVGHVYPIFFKFKGGKGVATMLGALLGLSPLLGLAAIVTWLLVAFLSRYSSLAAIVTCVVTPIYTILLPFSSAQFFLPLVALALLLIYRHRPNIERLRRGEEDKIQLRRKGIVEAIHSVGETDDEEVDDDDKKQT
ncbi:MAG: glycerol-3-phosphate 1-O-acyltransferase PlsY [Gammaproteobacteria bacterium]|nr:glycerol-3-phosphate 1-O-acyltransferase PlsY [Gammaproteobacteria bacterium]